MKESIQILPGLWIEITPRVRQMASLRKHQRLNVQVDRRHLEDAAPRRSRKYSRLLLDEAVKLSQEKGLAYAAKKTGINKWSISMHARDKRTRRNINFGKNKRYTVTQKQACVRLAQEIMAKHEIVHKTMIIRGKSRAFRRPKWGYSSAFIEAGRRLGLNGYSIYFMWSKGWIKLPEDSPSTHPSLPSVPAMPSMPPVQPTSG